MTWVSSLCVWIKDVNIVSFSDLVVKKCSDQFSSLVSLPSFSDFKK